MDLSSNLLPRDIRRSEVEITSWFLRVVPGVTPRHVVDPEFWAHLAGKLRVDHRIEVVAADGSFDADLRVVAVDTRGEWAQIRVLRMTLAEPADLPADQWPDKDGYRIEFSGPQKHRIISPTNEVVASGFPDEAAAVAALAKIKAAKPRGKAA